MKKINKTENILSSYKNLIQSESTPVSSVLDFIDDVIISVNSKGIVTIFNKSAEKTFSFNQNSAIGKKLETIDISGKYFNTVKKSISEVLKTNKPEYQQIDSKSSRCIINTAPIIIDRESRGAVVSLKKIKDSEGEMQIRKKDITGFSSRYCFNHIISRNPEILRIVEKARYFSQTNTGVLIQGESGVGKEIFAQSIHSESSRKDKPFVAVNCAALPSQLLESELFGYEEGAFTGAQRGGKKGLFELADSGTMFLDEISEIDQNMQVKFLRAFEEKQIKRIGGSKLIDIEVQIITATNRDLNKMVGEGDFRADLFYRINLLKLEIPPLRNRKDDIEYLTAHFIKLFNRKYFLQIESFSIDALSAIKNYSWPGNIRELKNIVGRAALTVRKGYIKLIDIKSTAPEIFEERKGKNTENPDNSLSGTMDEIKSRAVLKTLKESRYNKSLAARKLDIDRSTLDRLIEQSYKQ